MVQIRRANWRQGDNQILRCKLFM